jgi:hypothetical protein
LELQAIPYQLDAKMTKIRSQRGFVGRLRSSRIGVACCAVVVAFVLAGCSSDPFSYVDVTGTVQYEDGSQIPAAFMTVTFESQSEGIDEKTRPRPGMAVVKEDGTFGQVTSSPQAIGKGIVPGKHKVVIRAFDDMEAQLDVIPPEYSDVTTTPIEIDTNEKTHFDLKIKKPVK